MANIQIQKKVTPAPIHREWDPFKMMRDMVRWDPFAEMLPTLQTAEAYAFSPAFDVTETKDGFIFKADVPGIAQKDIEVTLTGNRLTVAGKREREEEQKSETSYVYERAFGSFTRSFTIPEGADAEHVKADLSNGVLTLQLAKLPEAKSRKIELSPSKA